MPPPQACSVRDDHRLRLAGGAWVPSSAHRRTLNSPTATSVTRSVDLTRSHFKGASRQREVRKVPSGRVPRMQWEAEGYGFWKGAHEFCTLCGTRILGVARARWSILSGPTPDRNAGPTLSVQIKSKFRCIRRPPTASVELGALLDGKRHVQDVAFHARRGL